MAKVDFNDLFNEYAEIPPPGVPEEFSIAPLQPVEAPQHKTPHSPASVASAPMSPVAKIAGTQLPQMGTPAIARDQRLPTLPTQDTRPVPLPSVSAVKIDHWPVESGLYPAVDTRVHTMKG